VGVGGPIYGAVRVTTQPHDGEVSYEWSGRLRSSDNEVISESTLDSTESADSSEPEDYELWLGYSSVGLTKGNYKLGFSVRDRITDALDRTQIDIGVVEQLKQSEVSKVAQNLPENAITGEEFDMSITLRSSADRDSSIVSPFSVKRDNSSWNTDEELLRWNVPGSQDKRLPYSDVVYDKPGTYTFRIDDYGIQWSVDVSPSS
jgi:hypothetical protein